MGEKTAEQQHPFAHYPMGPELRAWAGISRDAYKGEQNPEPEPREQAAFSAWLINTIREQKPASAEQLTTLVDETLGMGLPFAALYLIDCNPSLWMQPDFRALLTEGIAAMLGSELPRAETCFRKAQQDSPHEPAPYVNLVRIMHHDQRWNESGEWLEAGLRADKNHIPLWELLYAQLGHEHPPESIPRFLKEYADTLNSWAGMSLLADCLPDTNSKVRAQLLEPFYRQGERSGAFLTEYTGALGSAGEYEQIPSIVWQAQKLSSENSWQLLLHGAQAHLALEQKDAFMASAQSVLRHPQLPADIRKELLQMIKESSEEGASKKEVATGFHQGSVLSSNCSEEPNNGSTARE